MILDIWLMKKSEKSEKIWEKRTKHLDKELKFAKI